MRFKEKVKILTDRGLFKEVKGTCIPYEDKTFKITVMAHLSEDIWQPDTIDVSEKSTGCRLFSIAKVPAKEVDIATVLDKTKDFVKLKGKKAILQQIENQLLSNPHIYTLDK